MSKSEYNLRKVQRFLWNDKAWLDYPVFKIHKGTELHVIGERTILEDFLMIL